MLGELGVHAIDTRVGEAAWRSRAPHRKGARDDVFAGQGVEEPPLQRCPDDVWQFGPAIFASDRTPVRDASAPLRRRCAMSPRRFVSRNCSYAASSARSSWYFSGDANASAFRSCAFTPAMRSSRTVRPQRLRHRRLIGERAEVAAVLGQFKEQPHDERRAESFFGRIDAAFDEKRRAHAEGDVERSDEAEVQPVGASEGQAFTERAANRVGGNEDPLGASVVKTTQLGELCDEWGKHSAGHLLFQSVGRVAHITAERWPTWVTQRNLLIQIHRSTGIGAALYRYLLGRFRPQHPGRPRPLIAKILRIQGAQCFSGGVVIVESFALFTWSTQSRYSG